MPTGVYTRSEETRRKMSENGKRAWILGISPLSNRKGRTSYNKGRPMHPNAVEALRKANTGRKQSAETIEKRVSKLRGRKHTEEYKLRMSGKNSVHWKGGKRGEVSLIRGSFQYKKWRLSVYVRDNFTCVTCGDKNYKGRNKSVKLEADHIKPFAHYPELRFDVSNGRTLCVPCHKLTDTYAGKCVNFKKV